MYCILVAGMPASGKSTFAAWLSREKHLPCMSKDQIKELLFDAVGFRSRQEKVALGTAAEKILYAFAQTHLAAGLPFILENNFEDSSREGLVSLLEKYGCFPITVLFDGDIEVLYQRFILRDQSPARHRGHVVNTQYPETGEPAPYCPMSLEDFRWGMEARGFARFHPGGAVLRVDCTDFARVDYSAIVQQIEEILRKDTLRKDEKF